MARWSVVVVLIAVAWVRVVLGPAVAQVRSDPQVPRERDPPASLPSIARFLGLRVGLNSREDLERRLGPGMTVRGMHPSSGRVWRYGRHRLIIHTDGFNYSRSGQVIEQLSLGPGPYAEKIAQMPRARLQPGKGWMGVVLPGMTKAQVRRALGQRLLPPRIDRDTWTWTARGFARMSRHPLDVYWMWKATLTFRRDRLIGIEVACP